MPAPNGHVQTVFIYVNIITHDFLLNVKQHQITSAIHKRGQKITFSSKSTCSDVIFTRESSYCFQRVLEIAILSVCLSVRHMGGSVKIGAS